MRLYIYCRRWFMFLLVVTIFLMVGCSTYLEGTEEVLAPTATPDPLYGLDCTAYSDRVEFCVAGLSLINDQKRMEKMTRDYCYNREFGSSVWCSIFVWKDKASVAQKTPLTEAETASLIARFWNSPNSGKECFQAWENGAVIYSTSGCPDK